MSVEYSESMQTSPTPERTVVRDFFSGMSYLGRGLALWCSAPKLMMLGALPALIIGTMYGAGLIAVAVNAQLLADWLTPFAAAWPDLWRSLMRIAAVVAVLGLTLLFLVYTFVAVTLTVGDVFYERIWQHVENMMGDAPPALGLAWWRSVWASLWDAVRLLLVAALIGFALFAAGFIPLLGQTVVPVIGALAGGWILTVELTGFALQARGLSLRERRRMLAARRARTLGFGVATYVLFLVPLGAILTMPAAVAGATMLARDAHAQSVAKKTGGA
jgi:CysZ protein